MPKTKAKTKTAQVFELLDKDSDISTEDALKKLKGVGLTKQTYYGIRHQWRKAHGVASSRKTSQKTSKASRTPVHTRRRLSAKYAEAASEIELRLEVDRLQRANERLKGAVAVLLG